MILFFLLRFHVTPGKVTFSRSFASLPSRFSSRRRSSDFMMTQAVRSAPICTWDYFIQKDIGYIKKSKYQEFPKLMRQICVLNSGEIITFEGRFCNCSSQELKHRFVVRNVMRRPVLIESLALECPLFRRKTILADFTKFRI